MTGIKAILIRIKNKNPKMLRKKRDTTPRYDTVPNKLPERLTGQ